MARGILAGIIWGTLVGILGVVLASRFLEPRDLALPAPEAGGVAVPAGSGFNAERPDSDPVLPGTDARPPVAGAPLAPPTVAGAAPMTETEAAATPETGAASGSLAAPSAEGAAVSAPGVDTGVLPPPGTVQPRQPGVDGAPSQATPLPAPEAGAPETAALMPPESGNAPATVSGDTSVPPAVVAPAPSAPGPEATPAGDDPAAAPRPAAPGTVAAPEIAPDAPNAPLPGAPAGLQLDLPQFGNLAPDVATDRLPRIGAEPELPAGDAIPAIERNAVAFENAAGNPMMALVLVDGGDGPDPATLSGFPVPLTVAVDPSMPDAGARMAAYRAAGLEVVVLAPLPEAAAPADVEVAFQVYLGAVPQAVAVMDLPSAVLQSNRPRAAQVAAILSATGHGLITYDKGLNTGLQIAQAAGVPAALVFRAFDDGSRDGAAMKRFLDQGSFRAGQVGPVVLSGELRAETLAAITEWSLSTRAATISLAPVSAVLKGQ